MGYASAYSLIEQPHDFLNAPDVVPDPPHFQTAASSVALSRWAAILPR
jgi:hypothetical protein